MSPYSFVKIKESELLKMLYKHQINSCYYHYYLHYFLLQPIKSGNKVNDLIKIYG